jgi:hypothetical protein
LNERVRTSSLITVFVCIIFSLKGCGLAFSLIHQKIGSYLFFKHHLEKSNCCFMKPENSFNVDFDYALSETITLKLTASVQIKHSIPHYRVSNFHFKNNPSGPSLLPDIDIKAINKMAVYAGSYRFF